MDERLRIQLTFELVENIICGNVEKGNLKEEGGDGQRS